MLPSPASLVRPGSMRRRRNAEPAGPTASRAVSLKATVAVVGVAAVVSPGHLSEERGQRDRFENGNGSRVPTEGPARNRAAATSRGAGARTTPRAHDGFGFFECHEGQVGKQLMRGEDASCALLVRELGLECGIGLGGFDRPPVGDRELEGLYRRAGEPACDRDDDRQRATRPARPGRSQNPERLVVDGSLDDRRVPRSLNPCSVHDLLAAIATVQLTPPTGRSRRAPSGRPRRRWRGATSKSRFVRKSNDPVRRPIFASDGPASRAWSVCGCARTVSGSRRIRQLGHGRGQVVKSGARRRTRDPEPVGRMARCPTGTTSATRSLDATFDSTNTMCVTKSDDDGSGGGVHELNPERVDAIAALRRTLQVEIERLSTALRRLPALIPACDLDVAELSVGQRGEGDRLSVRDERFRARVALECLVERGLAVGGA